MATNLRMVLCCVLVLGGCLSPEEPVEVTERQSAIVGGAVDLTQPAVVALLGSGSLVCTGSIVKVDPPSAWVLTAADCVDSVTEARVGNDLNSPDAILPITSAVTHPGHTPDNLATNVAFVVVGGATPETPTLEVLRGPDSLAVGSMVALVGYGTTPAETSRRHAKPQVVSDVAASQITIGDASGTACFGDSGAPLLEANTVLGVTASGSPDCTLALAVRLESVQEFMTSVLDEPDRCAACQDPLFASGGACVADAETCSRSADCTMYQACQEACSGEPCLMACATAHAEGAAIYQRLVNCVCSMCSEECGCSPSPTMDGGAPDGGPLADAARPDASADAASPGSDAASPGTPEDSGGCGCVVVGNGSNSLPQLPGLLLFLLGLRLATRRSRRLRGL